MQFLDLLWIFLILISLQPVVRQRILEAARVRILRELEHKRGSRVIILIHRQETLSLLGFPVARFIDIQDSEDILRAIKLTGKEVPIDLILHTPGGLVLAAEQIAYALRKHPATVTVLVPHYAMSGGTLIALAADEVVMDDNAVLGPVDPQVGQFPAPSILKAIEQKHINALDDETLIMGDVARKAIAQVRETVRRIVSDRLPSDKAEALSDLLTRGQWTHDYPISVEEARAMGLSVSTEMPEDVYKLMSLFPQTTQRRPSVEYIPMPYAPRPRPPAGTPPESK
jgi:ClpP class serine protease